MLHKTNITQDDTFRSGMMCRVPSVPVTGRRITADSSLVMQNDENVTRFPIPVAFDKPKRPATAREIKGERFRDISPNIISRGNISVSVTPKPKNNAI